MYAIQGKKWTRLVQPIKRWKEKSYKKGVDMKRPAEKLYRIQVTMTWFERHVPDRKAVQDLSLKGLLAVTPRAQHRITAIEIKRRFRV